MTDAAGLLWSVQVSARYHARRQAFFERWHNSTTGISAFFGSAAGGNALAQGPVLLTAVVSFLLAGVAAFDLAVGTGRKASKHRSLRKQFLLLEADIRANGDTPPLKVLNRLERKRLSIETEEPPIHHALVYLCVNELARSAGEQDRKVVPCFQKITSNLWYWKNFNPKDCKASGNEAHPERR